jgi:MarR family transcriptional regulator, transcriptional regulator for hemolysin
MESTRTVLFYKIEKAIKSYRQFAQRRLKEAGLKITVDQWLTLDALQASPELSQKQLAAQVFKDEASITRILNLLIRDGYLKRTAYQEDQRRSVLSITPAGKSLLRKAEKVVESYRAAALQGIGKNEIEKADRVMRLIAENCQP